MQVVLMQDVKDLGKKGELVNVSDGYGKNYLIPRKLAKKADASALNEIKNKEAAQRHRKEVERQNALDLSSALDGKTVRVSARAGQNGKLFGSVTSKDVSEALKDQYGFEVDKKCISMDDVRSFGTYTATLKLYTGITALVYVVVGE